MRFIDLQLARARKLIRRGGLKGARISLVRALARKYLSVPLNVLSEYDWILNEDSPANLSAPPPGPLRISWILAGIPAAHGGLFNIFRAIQQLESWGHENRVYVLGSLPGGSSHAREQIRKNYFAIKAEIRAISGDIEDSDALIATSWPTAYAARKIGNTARKFYFIQDIEYMFYAPGSLHEFARRTYEFGFRGITAGAWIADVLKRDFNMDCTPFGFSYDRNAYVSSGSRMLPPDKKRVLFYARPETERRGFELGILTLSLVAKKLPNIEFVLVGFSPGSLELPFASVFPGVLPLSDLGALYRSCDVALVLSHTNLSLLPLELMACGCTVVSNSGPNTEWLLNNQNSRLADMNPASLAKAIIEVIENDVLRQRLIDAGLAFVQTTDWTKEIKTIESALLMTQQSSDHLHSHA